MAGLNQGLSNLVVKSFNRALEKKLPIIQSVGKLAKEQISVIGRIGQEVEFILEPEVSVGTYVEPIVYQSLNTPVVPIPVNRALDFAFRISDLQAKQLNALPNDKATELVTAAISNGIDKYNFAMEASMIALAPLAGYKLNNSTGYNNGGNFSTPINLNYSTIVPVLEQLRAVMGDGVIVDGVARTGWVEGKMNLYLPFAVAGLIPASSRMQYTSEGFGVVKNGFIGKIAGFNVFEHNGITRDSSGNYIIFAGVEGQTLGLIKQKDMEMEEMRDIATFSSNYRSLGLYGAGLIRPDKLAAAYVSVSYS